MKQNRFELLQDLMLVTVAMLGAILLVEVQFAPFRIDEDVSVGQVFAPHGVTTAKNKD